MGPYLETFPTLGIHHLIQPGSFLMSPGHQVLVSYSQDLVDQLQLAQDGVADDLGQQFGPGRVIAVLLGVEEPVPAPVGSSPSYIRPTQAMSVLGRRYTAICTVLGRTLGPLGAAFKYSR